MWYSCSICWIYLCLHWWAVLFCLLLNRADIVNLKSSFSGQLSGIHLGVSFQEYRCPWPVFINNLVQISFCIPAMSVRQKKRGREMGRTFAVLYTECFLLEIDFLIWLMPFSINAPIKFQIWRSSNKSDWHLQVCLCAVSVPFPAMILNMFHF